MSFELPEVSQVVITNTNTRTELHGDEKVRAIDISFCITGENTLLDRIQPGLREHHFTNRALESGQETVPGIVVPLPNLRFPRLPLTYTFAKGEKWRGYRFLRDYGTDPDRIDFSDVVLANLHYEIMEGGSCKVMATIQYNGEELQDNELYGELSGLASEGEIYVKLLAPAELLPVKKGYRAGRSDTPPPAGDDGGQTDLVGDGQQEGGDGDDEDVDTPEKALQRAQGGTVEAG